MIKRLLTPYETPENHGLEDKMLLLPAIAKSGAPLLDVVHTCDAYDLLAILPDKSVDLLLTDAPYNMTACDWETELDLPRWWTLVKRILKPRAACVMTARQPFTSKLVCSNLRMFRYSWVWDKIQGSDFQLAKLRPMTTVEDILVFSHARTANGAESNMIYYPQSLLRSHPIYSGGSPQKSRYLHNHNMTPSKEILTHRNPTSILRFPKETGDNRDHPTQKPVALFDYLIRTYTQPGDLVVDPFVGSGTAAVAARNLGRRYICGDQSAEYVSIAKKRLAQPFTLPMFPDAPAPPVERPQTVAMFERS